MKSLNFDSFRLGLDPAKPMFEDTSDNDSSLDKSDADFVEYINFELLTRCGTFAINFLYFTHLFSIIHSCGGLLGYAKPLGHV